MARRLDIHAVYAWILPITRRRRMRRFEDALAPTDATSVLDAGGLEPNWQYVSTRPRVTLVNVAFGEGPASPDPRFTRVEADARSLPWDDASFDVAYSNSVIEHVGDFEDQRRFAAELRRVGRSVWVQTPARGFPVEPHYMTVGLHWLPRPLQKRLLRWLSLWGWLQRPTRHQVDAMVDEIRLLGRREMQELFPDCEIRAERVLGIPRSWVAVRRRA